ncbi:MAG TPA: accessory gene regulator B family protein [Clostridiales bacterium]|nr:accessory gene regulator B family protein [Clostridiales bacterium]HPV01832.1 accessory gene regulator B family protein [Clostridiales bacterium]
MFDKISKYMADMIYSTLEGVDPEKREIIEYGVYMIVSEIVKISIILAVSLIFRIVPYVAAAIVAYGIQRTLLGGIHAKSHLGCMITHSAIVFGIVAASLYSNIDRIYLLLIIAPFSYVAAYLYAPADLPQKPVKSKKQRKQLRIGGFILLTCMFAASWFLPAVWSNIILFSCFLQAVFMTPLAYRISGNKYGREEVSA